MRKVGQGVNTNVGDEGITSSRGYNNSKIYTTNNKHQNTRKKTIELNNTHSQLYWQLQHLLLV